MHLSGKYHFIFCISKSCKIFIFHTMHICIGFHAIPYFPDTQILEKKIKNSVITG